MSMFPAQAYLIAGAAALVSTVQEILVREGIESADILVRTYDRFGIDEARDVREHAALRAVLSERRAFVLAPVSMTTEAQNALLKLFEDPPPGALFILVTPMPDTLLPTLRSRMQVCVLPGESLSPIDPRVFLAARPAERLELLKPLLGTDERDAAALGGFLAALEGELSRRPAGSTVYDGFRSIYQARKYLGDKGALVKPLIESVALTMPVL